MRSAQMSHAESGFERDAEFVLRRVRTNGHLALELRTMGAFRWYVSPIEVTPSLALHVALTLL